LAATVLRNHFARKAAMLDIVRKLVRSMVVAVDLPPIGSSITKADAGGASAHATANWTD
jgi:hypothetical protein